ncbi:MAG: hypothetical protein IKE85_08390 [Mogibacterium sp.]|nr:hypothetical protein [Mogibacterium sp.]MBR2540819.1 hypothetical protein [Mogibacterium sp.]
MKEYSKEEQLRIYNGIAADGTFSKETEETVLAAIAEGKAEELLIGEVKRQLRSKLNGEQGKAVAAVVAKLW